MRFDHHPDSRAVGVCLEFLDFGYQEQRFEEIVNAFAFERRNGHCNGVTSIRLDDNFVFGKLGVCLINVRPRRVDLVNCHDDRHSGRTGVVDGFDSLGHHAVVSRHDQYRDIGHLRATGAHLGKRGVAGGVDERQ